MGFKAPHRCSLSLGHHLRTLVLACAAGLAAALAPAPARALEIIIVNMDNPGEGFNDPTPFNPVGGNPATTLGQARLNAVQYAANLLGQYLRGTVPVTVDARFDAFLPPQTGGTIIWNAGYLGLQNVGGINYAHALANNLIGADNSMGSDAGLTVNANLDWYLGLDGNVGPNQHDLVTGTISMLMGGLGFGTSADVEAGALGGSDSYTNLLAYYNLTNNPDMPGGLTPLAGLPSDAERATAFTSPGELVFTGTLTTAAIAAGKIDAATATEGYAPIYAPSGAEAGRTGSYLDGVSPLQPHRPFYTPGDPAVHHPGLGLYVLADIGWQNVMDAGGMTGIREGGGAAELSVSITPPSGSATVAPGNAVTYTVTVRNLGPGAAEGTSLTFFAPAGATLGAVTTSQGACTASGALVSCQLDDIAAAATVTVQVPATLGNGTATATGARVHSATVRVNSTASELDMGNNVASSTLASGALTLEDLKTGGGCTVGADDGRRGDPLLPALLLLSALWLLRRRAA